MSTILEPDQTTPALHATLTRRERVVLGELCREATLEAIAVTLFVSRNTVKSQVRSIYRKIGVGTRAEAVAWATANGAGRPVERRTA